MNFKFGLVALLISHGVVGDPGASEELIPSKSSNSGGIFSMSAGSLKEVLNKAIKKAQSVGARLSYFADKLNNVDLPQYFHNKGSDSATTCDRFKTGSTSSTPRCSSKSNAPRSSSTSSSKCLPISTKTSTTRCSSKSKAPRSSSTCSSKYLPTSTKAPRSSSTSSSKYLPISTKTLTTRCSSKSKALWSLKSSSKYLPTSMESSSTRCSSKFKEPKSSSKSSSKRPNTITGTTKVPSVTRKCKLRIPVSTSVLKCLLPTITTQKATLSKCDLNPAVTMSGSAQNSLRSQPSRCILQTSNSTMLSKCQLPQSKCTTNWTHACKLPSSRSSMATSSTPLNCRQPFIHVKKCLLLGCNSKERKIGREKSKKCAYPNRQRQKWYVPLGRRCKLPLKIRKAKTSADKRSICPGPSSTKRPANACSVSKIPRITTYDCRKPFPCVMTTAIPSQTIPCVSSSAIVSENRLCSTMNPPTPRAYALAKTFMAGSPPSKPYDTPRHTVPQAPKNVKASTIQDDTQESSKSSFLSWFYNLWL